MDPKLLEGIKNLPKTPIGFAAFLILLLTELACVFFPKAPLVVQCFVFVLLMISFLRINIQVFTYGRKPSKMKPAKTTRKGNNWSSAIFQGVLAVMVVAAVGLIYFSSRSIWQTSRRSAFHYPNVNERLEAIFDGKKGFYKSKLHEMTFRKRRKEDGKLEVTDEVTVKLFNPNEKKVSCEREMQWREYAVPRGVVASLENGTVLFRKTQKDLEAMAQKSRSGTLDARFQFDVEPNQTVVLKCTYDMVVQPDYECALTTDVVILEDFVAKVRIETPLKGHLNVGFDSLSYEEQPLLSENGTKAKVAGPVFPGGGIEMNWKYF